MTLKRWMLEKVNATGKRGPRTTTGRIAPSLGGPVTVERDPREPGVHGLSEPHAGDREATAHLGRYAPLIAAIREELEQFVTSELRLHLAIAERDRYLLTSIEVESADSEVNRELLRRFIAEFKPEQIKHYLARDVIGGLRNASAIDLTQFAGLNAMQEDRGVEEDDGYGALLAQLQSGSGEANARAYEVTIMGRWCQPSEVTLSAGVAELKPPPTEPRGPASPHTPLAGRTLMLDIEDANGARRVEVASIVPGRRYSIGKDESCDVVVDGVYASRRHCEIWFEKGTWWVVDTGSTNGIRVQSRGGVRRQAPAQSSHDHAPIELPPGASLLLSAQADGTPAQYPRIALPAGASQADEPALLVTPIAPPRPAHGALTIAAHMASGTREAEIVERALPFRIGRSRNQGLVIDWTHSDVSGRHVEITSVDETGALVAVHGENGVSVDGTAYAPGAQFRWKPGEKMLLGRRTDGQAPLCTLTLSRHA